MSCFTHLCLVCNPLVYLSLGFSFVTVGSSVFIQPVLFRVFLFFWLLSHFLFCLLSPTIKWVFSPSISLHSPAFWFTCSAFCDSSHSANHISCLFPYHIRRLNCQKLWFIFCRIFSTLKQIQYFWPNKGGCSSIELCKQCSTCDPCSWMYEEWVWPWGETWLSWEVCVGMTVEIIMVLQLRQQKIRGKTQPVIPKRNTSSLSPSLWPSIHTFPK